MGFDKISAYSKERANSMLPFIALPHTSLWLTDFLIELINLFVLVLNSSFSISQSYSERFVPSSIPDGLSMINAVLCGKMVFRQSMTLFLRKTSLVAPVYFTNAFSSIFLAPFRFPNSYKSSGS